MWQIQARLKTGTEWEPISVERPRPIGEAPDVERRYHYDTPEECQAALDGFCQAYEQGLPSLIFELAIGRPRLREKYDIRFVQITADAVRGTS